jgi:hypothetical protein
MTTPDSDWILVSVHDTRLNPFVEGRYLPLDAWTPEADKRGLHVYVATGRSNWGWILNSGSWLRYALRFPTQAEAQAYLDEHSHPAHTKHGPMGEPVRVDDPRLVPHQERHAEMAEQHRMADNRARSRAKAALIGRGRNQERKGGVK